MRFGILTMSLCKPWLINDDVIEENKVHSNQGEAQITLLCVHNCELGVN